MAFSMVEKAGKRILLITVSDPFDVRTDLARFLDQLRAALGELDSTTYLIYDIRGLSISFSDIISGVSGFGRPHTEFDTQLQEHSRMLLVGSGTLITIAAKTVSRLMPHKPTLVFDTPEKALEYAQSELENSSRQGLM